MAEYCSHAANPCTPLEDIDPIARSLLGSDCPMLDVDHVLPPSGLYATITFQPDPDCWSHIANTFVASVVAMLKMKPSTCPNPVTDLELQVAPASLDVSTQFWAWPPNSSIPTHTLFPDACSMGFQASGMPVEMILV